MKFQNGMVSPCLELQTKKFTTLFQNQNQNLKLKLLFHGLLGKVKDLLHSYQFSNGTFKRTICEFIIFYLLIMEYDSLSIIDILYTPFSSLPFIILVLCSDICKYKCFLYGQNTIQFFAKWQRKIGSQVGLCLRKICFSGFQCH